MKTRTLIQGVGIALAATLLPLTTVAQGVYDPETKILSVDAIDLQTNGETELTFSAKLELYNTAPPRFASDELLGVERPATGPVGTLETTTDELVLPSVAIGDKTYEIRFHVTADDLFILQFDDFVLNSIRETFSTGVFNRIATFPAYRNSDIDNETVAEIVDASSDGNTLVYTDSPLEVIGFVDITDARNPQPAGIVAVGGEPTSVAVAGNYALAAVDTSADFVSPSGVLHIIDMATHAILRTIDLGGQPDSVAVSPDNKYAVIAIENQRDEDLGDGAPPQLPAGFVVIVDLAGGPANWTTRNVSVTGLADLYPDDPEPEFVDINDNNIAAVTLQENNHIVLIDVASGTVIDDFSAGSVDLSQVDIEEEDPALISLTGSLSQVLREPDGIGWMGNDMLAIANEGDLNGGSRSFAIMDIDGTVLWDSGNSLDHTVVSLGQYPDSRSGNKGNEPENIEYADFGDEDFLFVTSERANVVYAYNLEENTMQTLPSNIAPEGIKAIPSRGLLIAAAEKDDRGDKYRGGLVIYALESGTPIYPTVMSANRIDGTPIPWSALSGLAADSVDPDTVYTVPDSYYQQSRIYRMNVAGQPAVINKEIVLRDGKGLLAAVSPDQVNANNTVNLDLEGIAVSADGGFWVVSEGAGSVNDDSRPVTSLDLLLHADKDGLIDDVVTLPGSTNDRQIRFGFEGVAATGAAGSEVLYVAFQREWVNDPKGYVRIGRYEEATDKWSFFYYPLDAATSPNGGWVGLSDITALNGTEFAILERDNQGNDDATIKRIYKVSVAGKTPAADPASGTPTFPVLNKTLVHDLIPEFAATGGMVLEKLEGMTVTADGEVLVVNDNDGVDDSNGETQLFRLGTLFE